MSDIKYRAWVTEEYEPKKFRRHLIEQDIDKLPENDVLIRVHYSALNYKDALSARGHKGISQIYPHTPGIDASGIVEDSKDTRFKAGDEVIVTGYDLGMNTNGGFGEYIRVPGDWIVKPEGRIGLRESMIYGTHGFTAGICMYEFERHGILPESGNILVTGASGGVGSLGTGMLAKAGYNVIASSGKTDAVEMLKNLGAKEVIGRNSVYDMSGKPLLPGRWAGTIETVGGNTLSSAIRSTSQRGVVCCLGNVESDKFETSVYPFLLRGVSLIGIDSAERPMDVRLKIWEHIFSDWRIDDPEILAREVILENLDTEINKILSGGQMGKVLINLID